MFILVLWACGASQIRFPYQKSQARHNLMFSTAQFFSFQPFVDLSRMLRQKNTEAEKQEIRPFIIPLFLSLITLPSRHLADHGM
jgi:hypothetical protein